ncbi:ferric-chelate reductase [Paramyrothecium foliicola]|nr:ferric-chelate reductase [Paramyrothecium foliicola]
MRPRWTVTAACYTVFIGRSFAQGAVPSLDETVCAKACRQTFRTVKFSDVPHGISLATQECTSILHQHSLYLCWAIYCHQDVRVAESRTMNHTCLAVNNSYLLPYESIESFTDKDVAQLGRFNATSPKRDLPFGKPKLPSTEFYILWARTLDAFGYVHHYHYFYGWAMGFFWAIVVAVGAANRALTQLKIWPGHFFPGRGGNYSWLKRNVIVPATFGKRCVQDFGGLGTLPPRIQTLTLLAFIFLNVLCCVHGYRVFEGNMYYPSETKQFLRHVSDRTGIISFANFPLIWLFGMRNNVVIWLTGWSFGTYTNFHRWVARVATLQAIIHSVGYTALIYLRGGWPHFWWLWTRLFWWTGEMATVFMSLIVILSVFWLRRRHYEIFLVAHVILSALVLATMLGHVSIFSGAYDALVWVPAMIWLLDRVIRMARIIALNPCFRRMNASVSYEEDAHLVRLIVPVNYSLCHIKPGTFYYLMAVNKRNFWESHPFTVASVSQKDDAKVSLQETSPLLGRGSTFTDLRQEPKRPATEMTFLIRPYDSFTSRLKKYAQSSHGKPTTIRLAIDGPYGESLPLEEFDKVLFVVGGVGIAVALSYLTSLTKHSSQSRIYIHWAVREPALAYDLFKNELLHALGNDLVRISVYMTASSGHTSEEAMNTNVEWKKSRMDIGSVVEDTMVDTEQRGLAVVACGPGKMADETRRAVAAKVGDSLLRIEYFEESFQW